MKKFKKGLVTAIVPSYNHKNYIEQCIRSIKEQTYKNIQLVVIDDGSVDGSVERIRAMQKIYEFDFYEQKNAGLSNTLNKAINEYAEGEYISICASDDYWHPDKIIKLVEYMDENRSEPMCFSKTIFVDQDDKVLDDLTRRSNKHLVGGNIFLEIITQKIHFLPGLIRAELYDKVGLYDPSNWTEDFGFNLKVSYRYSIGYVNEYLNYYRFPSNFNNKLSTEKVPLAHRACIDIYRESDHYNRAILEWNFRNFIWFNGFKDKKKLALKSMLDSKRLFWRPSFVKALLGLIFAWR